MTRQSAQIFFFFTHTNTLSTATVCTYLTSHSQLSSPFHINQTVVSCTPKALNTYKLPHFYIPSQFAQLTCFTDNRYICAHSHLHTSVPSFPPNLLHPKHNMSTVWHFETHSIVPMPCTDGYIRNCSVDHLQPFSGSKSGAVFCTATLVRWTSGEKL